mmetsp:Transcript_21110/g.46494  ORF Transcript_21110/g.46494 Transcript_21110/m.46494 type:complete len:274 (-) Transcript_21110:637-1458(-)
MSNGSDDILRIETKHRWAIPQTHLPCHFAQSLRPHVGCAQQASFRRVFRLQKLWCSNFGAVQSATSSWKEGAKFPRPTVNQATRQASAWLNELSTLMEPCRDAAAQVMQLVRNDGARKLLAPLSRTAADATIRNHQPRLLQILSSHVVQLYSARQGTDGLLRLCSAVNDHQSIGATRANGIDQVSCREIFGLPEIHGHIGRQFQKSRMTCKVDPLMLLLCDIELLWSRLGVGHSGASALLLKDKVIRKAPQELCSTQLRTSQEIPGLVRDAIP